MAARPAVIEEYIKKHGLIQHYVRLEGSWIPANLVVPRQDEFVVFGNDDGTPVVVINTAKEQFKIMHGDMVSLSNSWMVRCSKKL
jgi:hypothetical protein